MALFLLFRQAALALQRPAEDDLHLGVDRAQIVPGPAPEGVEDLGIDPHAMATVLPSYLWRFRVSGQYAEIKASAKNLKA